LFVADASAGVVWRAEHVVAPFGVAAAAADAPATGAAAATDAPAATDAGGGGAGATAATVPAPPLAVVHVSAPARLSGVAVLPPQTDRRAVAGRLDLAARLVWTDANAHAVRKASLHGARDAPFAASGEPASAMSPGGAAAAAHAARGAWNVANGPSMNRDGGASASSRRGAVLWPVAVRGVGGASPSSVGGEGGVRSVLPRGVVVAEYLGRVWLMRDDGTNDARYLLFSHFKNKNESQAEFGGRTPTRVYPLSQAAPRSRSYWSTRHAARREERRAACGPSWRRPAATAAQAPVPTRRARAPSCNSPHEWKPIKIKDEACDRDATRD
jgi:hypothetical protein